MSELRVEALPFDDIYLAVLHRPGVPDEILDGPDGKPRRFSSAGEAHRAGNEALGLVTSAGGDRDPLGVEAWRQQRSRRETEESARVFKGFGTASKRRKRHG